MHPGRRELDLIPSSVCCLKTSFVLQDLVHFPPGFTHTPPVGLSITYTSPPASRRPRCQEGIVDLLDFFFFSVWTTEAGLQHVSFSWHISTVPARWKMTRASMADLEPCCPMFHSKHSDGTKVDALPSLPVAPITPSSLLCRLVPFFGLRSAHYIYKQSKCFP